VLVVIAAALVGANLFSVRDTVFGRATPAPRPAAVSPFVSVGPTTRHTETVLRSQPWWQGVRNLSGAAGASTAAFPIDTSASQWRAKWACRTGHLLVRASTQSNPLIDSRCPGGGSAYATRTGDTGLRISAGGAWTLRVDQQVDVPLEEPPLASMSAPGTVVAMNGSFQRIDQTGTGRVAVYRLANGSYALRLTNFYVTPNVDLQVRLSPLHAPRTTHQYLAARSAFVAPLDITAGSLNFPVPRGVEPTQYRSIVIWCPLVTSAYAFASLTPGR
jgi:hypothetical protein